MRKLAFLLLISVVSFAQPISQYKYVIVPSKFDAQKKPGQFGLNNLTKLFLEKNGYTVFYDTDILPIEVTGESCNKIYTNVYSDNTLRKTRLRVEVKDCRNAVLFVSEYGESAEKDNHVAYNQALRSAFKSFDKPEYRHNPAMVPTTSATVVEAVAPVKTPDGPKSIETNTLETTETASDILNAQPTATGYQLVDTTPKVVLRLYKTSNSDVFIAESDAAKGVVLKKTGTWIFEYYSGKTRLEKPLNIKF
jgi:hypothetical protein